MARIRTARGCVWALAVAESWIPEVPSADHEVERYTMLIDGRELVQVSVYQGERDLFSQGYAATCTVVPVLPRERWTTEQAEDVRRQLAQRLQEKRAVFAGEDADCIGDVLRQEAADGPDMGGEPLPGGTIARPDEDGVLHEEPAPDSEPYWRQRARSIIAKESDQHV